MVTLARASRSLVGAVILVLMGCGPTGGGTSEAPRSATAELDSLPRVVFETSKGQIVLELYRKRAPQSVANFLLLVRGGFYDGLTFHRVRPGFMIQAGYIAADGQRRATNRPPIQNEADNGLKNLRGTLAMARTSFPHSATTEFFVNVVDNPRLDYSSPTVEGFGYAVFGRVVKGMETVDAITAVPTVRRDEFEALPTQPIVITRAYAEQRDGAAAR